MNTGIFQQILILLSVTVLVIALFRRFHVPAIMGYLTVGVLVGYPELPWLSMSPDTHLLAEFGVVFLMFAIGLEFSLPKLMTMKVAVLGVGGAQVVITTLVAAVGAWLLGMSPQAAFAVGGVLAMSSTAIVSKQLSEQLELNSRHGRLTIGILLFQDLAVIPFLVIIPVLASGLDNGIVMSLGWALLKGVLVFFVLLGAGHWILRPLFEMIAAGRSPELFMLTILLVTLSAAWITQQAGLSLALGAFLAGMVISETQFRHQVEADIRPFQDVLLGLFFVTIGMRLDLTVFPQIWYWALLLALGIIVFKALLIMLLGKIAAAERGVALRAGLCLAQGGEFGFVLLSLAASYKLLQGQAGQIVLAGVLASMALAPIIIRYNGVLARRMYALSYGQSRVQIEQNVNINAEGLKQHVILCGYGRVGQNIARFLEQEGFEFIALDLDPDRVRQAQEAGDAVSYGDCARGEILGAAGLARARALVITYGELPSTLKILEHAHRLRPDLPVLVRTRDDADLEQLLNAGASEVVPETLEASLMLSSQLLLILGTPLARVMRSVRNVRNDRYRLLRGFFPSQAAESEGVRTQGERLRTVTLPKAAHAVGRTLEQLELDKLGVVVTAVRRGGIRGPQPEPYTRLRDGDVLILYGTATALGKAERQLLQG
ncbi:MAG TPA: cation:proton antiporter [Gammaproteobacteria bacterium]|nr:cation:proton antiporter [Gammaproteobacteria bacterium]